MLQSLAEVIPAGVWLAGDMNIYHDMESNLNISPKILCCVLEYLLLCYRIACLWLCNKRFCCLAGVAQQIEHQPENRKLAGLIPCQGTSLGSRPGPQLGVCKR